MARIHLDHNATTPLRAEAREALLGALDALAGNPSSVHAGGRAARAMLDDARERIAGALGVLEDDLIFTSGGTEADNLALFGTLRAADAGSAPRANAPAGAVARAGLVTTLVEHSAVLEAAHQLAREGHPVRFVGVGPSGRPDLDEVVRAAEGAALVSVMAANNEVGCTTDIGALVAALRERYGARAPRVHTDAVQALGKVPLDLAGAGVHLASFSAHKVGAPVGVGLLVRRDRAPLQPMLFGGGQEAALRPGTENVAAVHAFAVALELAVAEQAEFATRARRHVENLWMGVQNAVPGARILGPTLDDPERLPNTLSVLLPETDGRTLITRLDLAGLEGSAGSACASGSLEPSHVVLALGQGRAEARAALRLSTGHATHDAEITHAVEILSRTLGKAP
ncbi:MAG: cysteine desulfurase family protein [Planctomycetota bacterium]